MCTSILRGSGAANEVLQTNELKFKNSMELHFFWRWGVWLDPISSSLEFGSGVMPNTALLWTTPMSSMLSFSLIFAAPIFFCALPYEREIKRGKILLEIFVPLIFCTLEC
jgi:hypothetical protein